MISKYEHGHLSTDLRISITAAPPSPRFCARLFPLPEWEASGSLRSELGLKLGGSGFTKIMILASPPSPLSWTGGIEKVGKLGKVSGYPL